VIISCLVDRLFFPSNEPYNSRNDTTGCQ
jgi:hypothetical protein